MIQIWRAGCLVHSDYIAELLDPLLETKKENILYEKKAIEGLKKGFRRLRRWF
jgi:6-phosphogluconate dehydrogenase